MTAAPPGLHWFCARLRSRADFAVRDALSEQGIETFLPTTEQRTRWTDRQVVTTRPLFAGYIFGRFDPGARNAVLRTRGVVGILGIGEPEAIPDEEITNLQRLLALPVAAAECPYVAGEAVTVGQGPLAGVSGVVVRTKGATRLVIACEILRRAVSVEIDASDVLGKAEKP